MIQLVSQLSLLSLSCVQPLLLFPHLPLHLQPRPPSIIVASCQCALTAHLITYTYREYQRQYFTVKMPVSLRSYVAGSEFYSQIW